MKDRLIIFFKRYPVFLFLLPVFFVLHGYIENYDFVAAKDAIPLTGLYFGFSLFFYLISWLFYKNWMKAALIAFFIMAFHFFFGSIQDFLRNVFPGSFIAKYIFILPLSFCLFLFIIIPVKKRKRPLMQLAFYLNSLFLLLIVIDVMWLLTKTTSGKQKHIELSKEFIPCPECNTPDVYIIIADEYAGDEELKNIFHYDDSAFFKQIKERGFHIIPNSSSNYFATPYSIASTLNMDYLEISAGTKHRLLTYSYETIRDNKFVRFLQSLRYRLYNYSDFSFKGHPPAAQETFLPASTRLISGQTFLSRLDREIRFNLISKFNSQTEIRRVVYADRENNGNLLSLTMNAGKIKSSHPKIVFTHLMMPHYPYYYDKNGNEFPFELVIEGNQYNLPNYIEYLQYSNKKLLEMVDQILKNSPTPPIIVLMGDHGFRHFRERVDTKYLFCNFVSVHLPDGNYSAFKDSLTNVNLLRTLLNTSFHQQLSYLQDTTFLLDNP